MKPNRPQDFWSVQVVTDPSGGRTFTLWRRAGDPAKRPQLRNVLRLLQRKGEVKARVELAREGRLIVQR